MERHTKVNIWYFILAFLAVVWLRDAWIASRHVEQISYSEFRAALEQGRVERSRFAKARYAAATGLRLKTRKPPAKGRISS